MNTDKYTRKLKRMIDDKRVKIICLFTILYFIRAHSLFAQTVWLDQLDLSTATQGFGTPQERESNRQRLVRDDFSEEGC